MAPPKKNKKDMPKEKPKAVEKSQKKTEPKKSSSNQTDMLKMIAGDIGNPVEEKEEVKFVPSRMLPYNRASVIGGFPASGTIYEIKGPNGGGKTALGIEILASAQAAGHLTSFHDHERAANDPRWIKALGLDLNSCVYRNKHKDGKSIFTLEDSAEEINEMCLNFIENKRKGNIPEDVCLFVLVDSVAGMVPKAKVSKGAKVGDANYGLTARLLSDWLPTLQAIIGGQDIAVIFLNQTRVNVGAKPWEPKTKSFGGEALQFFAHMRIDVKSAGEVKEKVEADEIVVGRKHRFKIEKNKLGYPQQEGMFYTSNGLGESPLGFDDIRCSLDEALLQGIITKDGAYYESDYFDLRIHGERRLRIFLRENEQLYENIKEAVNELIRSGKSRLVLGDGESEDDDE